MNFNSISLVITTRNSIRTLPMCIESIYSQNLNGYSFELIVVDNFSTDGTNDYLSSLKFNNFKFYTLGPERSEQRNFGISLSQFDIVGYIDSDMYLTSGLIKYVIDCFNSQNVDAIKVPEVIYGNGLLLNARRFERMIYSNSYIDSARFMKKSIFNLCGGFCEGIPGSEDWELDAKLIQSNAKFAYIERKLIDFNPYIHNYGNLYHVEGFIHDESDITLSKLLEKKSYYKNADKYLLKYLEKENSPLINVFSLSYRLKLFFDLKNIFKFRFQYFYFPIIFFYRILHLFRVNIFKY